MTQVHNSSSDELSAIDSSGNTIALEKNVGCTLGIGTYFFLIRPTDAPYQSIHLMFDATVIGLVTIETNNVPGILEYDTTTLGGWIHEDPSSPTPYIGGSGFTQSNMSITITGAGGAMYNLGNLGVKRLRVKIVTTVGGKVRCGTLGKY